MSSPSISVALCTHNGARFLEEQLQSILGQSVLPAELVISDDASTDATLAIVERVVSGHGRSSPRSPRLRVLRNEAPLGVARNFEQAVLACTGDLIVLCDQDDRWHPSRLERVTGIFAARRDLTLLHGDARLIDADGRAIGASLAQRHGITARERSEIERGQGFRTLVRRNIVTGATTVFRRTLLEHAVPFPPGWVHDEWLAIVAAAIGRIDYLDDQLVDYRQHTGNQIGVGNRNLRAKAQKLLQPRIDRNRRLVSRADVLLERLSTLGTRVPAEYRELAADNLTHECARQALPVARLGRILPVIREAGTGRYASCGRGRDDIARDLVQPAR